MDYISPQKIGLEREFQRYPLIRAVERRLPLELDVRDDNKKNGTATSYQLQFADKHHDILYW